ncbi:MAG: sterol carrier protein domain-containing protein, partial [Gammaproteobacteria bacterium]|nr:sterol carrier protein domain-containing protein [Gammaproteobacteria bacterium]
SAQVNHEARNQEIKIRDLAWLTPDAYRSLWSFLARHDLVGRVTWDSAPIDDPATEYFREPRMLKTRDHEGLWLRVVDVAPALEGRGYDTSANLVIGIADDPLTPWNGGSYEMEISPAGARVSKTDTTPEVSLSLKTLASLYSGFRRATDLEHWGYLKGSTDAIVKADQIFATRHAPHCPDHF